MSYIGGLEGFPLGFTGGSSSSIKKSAGDFAGSSSACSSTSADFSTCGSCLSIFL